MKSLISLVIILCLLFSMSVTPYAESSTSYVASKVSVIDSEAETEEYLLEVPSKLIPGETAIIKLSGSWSPDTTYTVSTPSSVVLTNVENSSLTSTVTITFGGMSLAGNNLTPVSMQKNITVGTLSNVFFGRWRGILEYTVTCNKGQSN